VTPVASVVVAVRDGRETIARAVRSALDQSLRDLEVIVVDDASRDGTAAAARGAADGDARLRVLTLAANLGPSGARNRGFAAARGRWIAVLDADDAFAPERLARLVGLGEARGADMICDDLMLVDEETGAALGPMAGADGLPETIDAAAFVRGNLPDRSNPRRGYGFLKPVLRAAFLRAHGLAYDEDMRFAEDYAFALACLLHGAAWATMRAPLYRYAVRGDSLTGRHGAADLTRLCAVDERALASPAAARDPDLRRALAAHLVSVRKRERWAAFIDHVKARRLAALPGVAAHSPPVLAHIAAQLLKQAVLRSGRAAARLGRR
jgi:glycosyltransferase involved in cell wall biosynthesis